MKAIDRRAFLKGSFGAATTLTVLAQGRSSGAENKVVMGFMCLGRHGGGWQVFEGDP